jgi:hypothetical protein
MTLTPSHGNSIRDTWTMTDKLDGEGINVWLNPNEAWADKLSVTMMWELLTGWSIIQVILVDNGTLRVDFSIILLHDSQNTGTVGPEETAVARERSVDTFPNQWTRDATIEKFWKRCFLLGPIRSYMAIIQPIESWKQAEVIKSRKWKCSRHRKRRSPTHKI